MISGRWRRKLINASRAIARHLGSSPGFLHEQSRWTSANNAEVVDHEDAVPPVYDPVRQLRLPVMQRGQMGSTGRDNPRAGSREN